MELCQVGLLHFKNKLSGLDSSASKLLFKEKLGNERHIIFGYTKEK